MIKNASPLHPYNIDAPMGTSLWRIGRSSQRRPSPECHTTVPDVVATVAADSMDSHHNSTEEKPSCCPRLRTPVRGDDYDGLFSHAWWRCSNCVHDPGLLAYGLHRTAALSSFQAAQQQTTCAARLNGCSHHANLGGNDCGGSYNFVRGCCGKFGCGHLPCRATAHGSVAEGVNPMRYWPQTNEYHSYNYPHAAGRAHEASQLAPSGNPTTRAWYQVPCDTSELHPLSQPYNISERPSTPQCDAVTASGGVEAPDWLTSRARARYEQSRSRSPVCTPCRSSPVLGGDVEGARGEAFAIHRFSCQLESLQRRLDALEAECVVKSGVMHGRPPPHGVGEMGSVYTADECPSNRSTAVAPTPSTPATPPPLPPEPKMSAMDSASHEGTTMKSPPYRQVWPHSTPSSPTAGASDNGGGITLERLMRAVRSARERARQQDCETAASSNA
ncbi:hypothetical protein DPX39_010043800 [Trypanosoma brucei equiperdum]|uniref:Uncharacterized protein n=1 Tax=Trypanosoma brucei equiperdum TaxID=630700 RepID=A0A3L6LCJ8_9TRYP|nr:hypothetical protein DPX39_010043800 [Trypanosoma brucei equiperdum]